MFFFLVSNLAIYKVKIKLVKFRYFDGTLLLKEFKKVSFYPRNSKAINLNREKKKFILYLMFGMKTSGLSTHILHVKSTTRFDPQCSTKDKSRERAVVRRRICFFNIEGN